MARTSSSNSPAATPWLAGPTTCGGGAEVVDQDPPQGPPAGVEDLGTEDPPLIVFPPGTPGEPRGVVHACRYLSGQAIQAEHWLGSRPGELVWCTTATGWSKS